MAFSIVQFVGDGSSRTYSFPFPYVSQDHIVVTVGVDAVAFVFDNTNTITLDTAAASGARITIARQTPKVSVPVDFSDGSILREADLDTLAIFSTYVSQETYDRADQSLGFDTATGKWEASSFVIKNVGNPVDAGDAVNKGTIDNLYPFVSTVAGSIGNVNIVGAAISNVGVVAGSITNVNTVGAAISNVNKVAAVDAKVTTVANNDANVTTVAGSIASVNTAAGSIVNVNTVGAAIINVNTVAANITSVNTVAGNNANVSKVGAIDTKVTTVANNDANVTTVAGISSAVSTVSGISGNVTTVATNNANVTAVANNAANVNTVAGNTTNINSAVANTANINAVVANATNINTVAGINADVTTVASNIAAIIDAPNQASGAAASAVQAAQSAASAASILDNFDDRYLGAKTSDPALDNDGDTLIVGALYFNTPDGVMKIYTSSGWLSSSSASVATLATFEFVATASQTVFTGTDADGQTLSYTAPAVIVALNGIRLRPGEDYTATDGVNITLIAAASLGDELVVDAFGNFLIADTYSKAQADSLIAGANSYTDTAVAGVDLSSKVSKSGDTITGNLIVNSNVGIGTSSPQNYGKLAVAGTIAAGTDQTDQVSLLGGGGTARVEATGGNASVNLALSAKGAGAIYFWRGGYGGTVSAIIDESSNLQFNSGYGSAATAYGCRAWVNFNGAGTVAIRGSGNVSSISDNGNGDYTVNFTTAMPDSNYAISSMHGRIGRILTGNGANDTTAPNWTASSCRIAATTAAAAPSFSDNPHLTISIFR